MSYLKQTKFGEEGNCLAACIASVLDFAIEDIPDFLQNGPGEWFQMMNEWLSTMGLAVICVPSISTDDYKCGNMDFLHLIVGPSPRELKFPHCVLGRQGKIIHDPHPDNTGLLDGAWSHYIFVRTFL